MLSSIPSFSIKCVSLPILCFGPFRVRIRGQSLHIIITFEFPADCRSVAKNPLARHWGMSSIWYRVKMLRENIFWCSNGKHPMCQFLNSCIKKGRTIFDPAYLPWKLLLFQGIVWFGWAITLDEFGVVRTCYAFLICSSLKSCMPTHFMWWLYLYFQFAEFTNAHLACRWCTAQRGYAQQNDHENFSK